MQNTPAKRNYALDAIKVVATIIILFHHHQQISGAVYQNHINFYNNTHFDWSLMVELFFMISGFFAYRTFVSLKVPFSTYMAQKYKRLLPAAAVSTSVYCVLTYIHYVIHGKPWFFNTLPNFWGLIVSCMGLQRGFGFSGSRLNNPTWFISVLIMCYIVFYLLAWLCKKHNWRLEWVMIITVIVTLNLQQTTNLAPFFAIEPLRGYQAFPLGVLTASFVSSYRVNKPLSALLLLSIAICLAFTVLTPGLVDSTSEFIDSTSAFIAPTSGFIDSTSGFIDSTSAFIFLIAPAMIILTQTETAQKLFRHSFWSLLSAISYNVYVWHFTLQLLLALIAPGIVFSQTVGGMYLFTLLAWIVGALSHYLIERPLAKYLPQFWNCVFVRK